MKEVILYEFVCIYCFNEKLNKYSCCGENHFEQAYEDREGNLLLDSELQGYEIVDDFTDETNGDRFYIEREKDQI